MEELLVNLSERLASKYFGKYRGFVTDRNDPEQVGRLKVRVPSLFGDTETGWAWPVVPYAGADVGCFFIPQVGDLVWVEFEEGDIELPLWVGAAWAKPGGKSEIPAEAQTDYPDQQIIKTKSAQLILLSDVAGAEKIVIRAKSGCEIEIDPNANRVKVAANEVIVQASTVKVQSSAAQPEELATKTFVEQVFDNHTHPSGVGPTGKPIPMPVPGILTSVLKAE